MQQVKIFTLFLALFFFLIGCQIEKENVLSNVYTTEEFSVLSKNLNLPESPYSYSFGNSNLGVEIDHKGTFGRALFYDKKLSADGTVACASCHQQALAFADDKAFSEGANGNTTNRNSLALGSLRSFGTHYDQSESNHLVAGLFWDERAATIKDQLKQTINNPNEMGMELQQIVDLVENTDYYRVLHRKAFNANQVSEDHILEALEIYINSISSTSSKLEAEVHGTLNYINGDSIVGVSEHELGLRLFQNNCNSCHNSSLNLFEDLEITERILVANNGLESNQNDMGMFEHTQNVEDMGKFKIPGLRNIELTAPYMHDGRFANLEEVVEFYNSGIIYHPNLHPNLKNGNTAKRLNLTEEEKTALVSFLKLLTDVEITKNEKWANPFLE